MSLIFWALALRMNRTVASTVTLDRITIIAAVFRAGFFRAGFHRLVAVFIVRQSVSNPPARLSRPLLVIDKPGTTQWLAHTIPGTSSVCSH